MNPSLRLPLISSSAPSRSESQRLGATSLPELLSDLQSFGLRLSLPAGLSRLGGAGPSDHKAIHIQGQTIMVPVFTSQSMASPFEAKSEQTSNGQSQVVLYRHSERVGPVSFPVTPRFYELSTQDGIPYFKLATLHSSDVLATTVMQNCTRFGNRETSCQFCAIGQSLRTKNTVSRKTPEQLAEVAAAAVRLDGVTQMVMTTGTPPSDDRGAAILAESARAIRRAVDIPLQGQCEPPADPRWFSEMKSSGIDTLGMHLEAVTEPVRRRIMPGKAEVSVEQYLRAFELAVAAFGRGEVTTYILAGLGDSRHDILSMVDTLSRMGVYPFVVPFVPIGGTPLESHPAPDAGFMRELLDDVAEILHGNRLGSQDASAGCGKCGACSTLRVREDRSAREDRRSQANENSSSPTRSEAAHA